MICEICEEQFEEKDITEHKGFSLCEDCYMEALFEGCGWTPFMDKYKSGNKGLQK